MSGTWPNLDLGDLETRIRTYINEGVASFYTDAEIDRWVSVAVKDIAQKSGCVRRILDAQTANGVRTVDFNAYKVHHVEYIPSSGRSQMLQQITPLQTGHFPMNGTAPQYWYEFGEQIGIDPKPDATYNLRLYVTDIPKQVIENGYVQAEWTAGTGWTSGASSTVHTGASSGDVTYTGTLVTATNYTVVFTASGFANAGTLQPYFGSTAGISVTANGIHMQTAVMNGTSFKFTASNDVTVDDIWIFKEDDFDADTELSELPSAWQHLIVLFATAQALYKDKKLSPGAMLETIYNNELMYLRQNIVEIIPDGRNEIKR